MKIILILALTALVATINFNNALEKLSFKIKQSFSEGSNSVTFIENKFCWLWDEDLRCLVVYTDGKYEDRVTVEVSIIITIVQNGQGRIYKLRQVHSRLLK
jgi:hypothetical protein